MLELEESGDVEVLASSGDAHLGGADFDAALAGWLGDELRGAGLPLPAGYPPSWLAPARRSWNPGKTKVTGQRLSGGGPER